MKTGRRAGIVMAMLLAAAVAQAHNVFMTGDSHVTAKPYVETVGRVLRQHYPDVNFSAWGKVGASFYSFNNTPSLMETIYEKNPDILVVNLGTNDSYASVFDVRRFTASMETFYNNVRAHLPDACIVFVTPFFNKNKEKGSGAFKVNDNTRLCAEAMQTFVQTHDNAYVVDNNAEYGMIFIEGGNELIRGDNVHLTVKGYETLGEEVAGNLLEISEIWEFGDEDDL